MEKSRSSRSLLVWGSSLSLPVPLRESTLALFLGVFRGLLDGESFCSGTIWSSLLLSLELLGLASEVELEELCVVSAEVDVGIAGGVVCVMELFRMAENVGGNVEVDSVSMAVLSSVVVLLGCGELQFRLGGESGSCFRDLVLSFLISSLSLESEDWFEPFIPSSQLMLSSFFISWEQSSSEGVSDILPVTLSGSTFSAIVL